MAMDPERIVELTTGPIFAWWVKHIAARLDPIIFKATNGRFTSMGPPAMPMLTMTTVGRKSGKRHAVHLACEAQHPRVSPEPIAHHIDDMRRRET